MYLVCAYRQIRKTIISVYYCVAFLLDFSYIIINWLQSGIQTCDEQMMKAEKWT